MTQQIPEVRINFLVRDMWPADSSQQFVADLGSERPTQWRPGNWLDDYPYIYVDGEYYYYP